MFDATIDNMTQTLQIVRGVDWLKERIEIIEDHTGTMLNIEEAVRSLKRSNTFEKLGGVEGAEFSNAQRGSGCTPGSRISLLAMLLVWAKDLHSPHLFWLSGLAGTGKTTVSKTFCSQLNNRGLLGASFFCTLKELNKKNVYLIIPTLARILAEERPKFGDALEKILESDRACRNPTKMDLNEQYTRLILQPAERTFAADELLVLGIDALDECENKDAVRLFIAAILSQKPTIPLKFFLTSRPEISLRESFGTSTHHGWLRLHDIEANIVKADILLYLHSQFKCISRVYNYYQEKSNWPPPEIQAIADASGTLFIIAATIVTYVATCSGNSLDRFQELGKPPPKELDKPSPNVQLAGIESLYNKILDEAFEDLEQKEADMIHSCLLLLVTAQRPVSVNDYAKLLSTNTLAIREAFKSLHSVVQFPDEGLDNALISIFHASFVDHLTSEKHQGKKWAVDRAAAHSATAEACFALMNSMLCFGISGAKNSYQSNENQPDPLELASELAYACTAWGNHVLKAGVPEPLQKQMLEFVKTQKILYWVEALKGKYIVSAMEDGTIQLWNAQTGQPALKPIKGHTHLVRSVAFSPDGKYIVSGSDDKTIRLWDAQTGQPALEPIEGHTYSVTSVAFSPDGKYIVSGSDDRTIRLWDAQTGQSALEPITGHIGSVTSVAFSPDGKYIVSGSHDRAIKLWNPCHGQLAYQDPPFLHNYPITALVLNNDGWIQNPSGNLLLWIPPHSREGLFLPGVCHIIGNAKVTKVELTNAVYHGADWFK
ncbi:hypothetical protein H1R20_g13687, partial [Candolleomyces eurysporus]